MKGILQDTQEFDTIQNELNKAIDNMNIDLIEENLARLSVVNPLPYTPEDSTLFAKKIINQNKKGSIIMKIDYKKLGTLVASTLLVITLGTTAAYAAGLLNKFTFFNKDTTVVVKTNQNLSDKEVSKLASDAAAEYSNPSDTESASSLPVDEKTFSSVEEIKQAFGIDIVIPSYLPKDFEMDTEIYTQTLPGTCQIYTTYTSKENPERRFGITVIQDELSEDSTHITVTDSVYKNIYKTPSGTDYTLFDENSGIIAQTEINNIQYALVFMGVSEKEIYKIIDSADLSLYIN